MDLKQALRQHSATFCHLQCMSFAEHHKADISCC